MKPLLTAIACGLIIWFAARAYHRQRPLASAAPSFDEHASTVVVLPATGASWSNLTSRPPVQMVSKSLSTASTSSVNDADSPLVDESALQSRTRELLARAALSSVGVDPEADQYWMAAITDENLAANDRRELILGLSDPRRAGPDDLALIASRIALIEQAAPQAIDDGDAAAFQEVYRDLLGTFSSLATVPTAPSGDGSELNGQPTR